MQILVVLICSSYYAWPAYKVGAVASIIIGQLLFTLYFFRNPTRVCLEALVDPTIIVSPADGTIIAIDTIDNQLDKAGIQRIAIFLSPLDVHVQWIPCDGFVEDITYKPGKFTPAFLPKSSERNERTDLTLRTAYGTLIIRQIAGTIARRIVTWMQAQQKVRSGQKYGMIKFGSRVEVLLPQSVILCVVHGQKVQGGHTILGKWQC